MTGVESPVSSIDHTVSLRLGHFPVEVLGETADDDMGGVPAAVVRAIRLYLNDKGSDRPGWDYPDLLRDRQPTGEVEMSIPINEDLWLAFEDEATRQGVTAARLASHAALYYAAELEAGHIPRRILEEPG